MPRTPTVLFIDDHHETLTAGLQQAVDAATGKGRFQVVGARDYVEAKMALGVGPEDAAHQLDVRVILLDQFFEVRRGGRFLREDLELAQNPAPALQDEQGLWIAQRLHAELGHLCPPIYLFTARGAEFSQVGDLVEGGIIEPQYRDKPRTMEAGDENYDALVRFLRRWLNPLAYLQDHLDDDALQGVDSMLRRFVEQHLADWRRDTPAILDRLIETAVRHTNGFLTFETWRRVQAEQPAVDPRWNDGRLWQRLLRPFGVEEGRWQSWRQGQEVDSTGRLCFFRITGTPQVLMWIDPRAIPADLTRRARQGLLGQVPRFPERRDNVELGKVYRWDLPAVAPGSTLPFLLGTVVHLPGDIRKWLPLSVHRARELREGEHLGPALLDVVEAFEPAVNRQLTEAGGFRITEQDRIPPGWGMLAEGALVFTGEQAQAAPAKPGRRRRRPFTERRAPLWPLHALGLSPDPARAEPLPYSYLQNLDHEARWLVVLTHWFAHGRLPDSVHGGHLARAWREARSLAQAEDTPLNLNDWWDYEGERPPHAEAEGRPLHLHGRTIHLRAESRCLSPEPRPRLRVSQPVYLSDCTLVLNATPQGPLSLFEQVLFEKKVRLHRCTLVDGEGNPAPLIVRDCRFESGFEVKQMDVPEVHFERCSSASQPGSELALQETRAQGEAKFTLGPGLAKLTRSDVGRLTVLLTDSASRFQFADRSTCWGSVALRGATGPGSPADVLLEQCHLRGEVSAGGELALYIRHSELDDDLSCHKALSQVDLDGVTLHGTLNLGGASVPQGVRIAGGQLGHAVNGSGGRFGPVIVRGTTCAGVWQFHDARFDGDVCIAQSRSAAGNSPEMLTRVVFREQLDFSGAQFHGLADFSNVVSEHEVNFQQAHFHADADFRRIQVRGNIIFSECEFHGQAQFDRAIVGGVFDAQGSQFTQPASFVQATLGRAVRLARARWPQGLDRPAVSFADALVEGMLDLAEPLDGHGKPLDPFWVDLTGVSSGQVSLAFAHQKYSFDACVRHPRSGDPSLHDYQVMALARLFEASLVKEVRFDEADYFYRKAKDHGPCRWWARPLRWLSRQFWGHGTQPWLAFAWLVGLSALFALLVALLEGTSVAAYPQVLREAFGHVILGESQLTEKPLGLAVDVTLMALFAFQAIFVNLFFVALARKMLR